MTRFLAPALLAAGLATGAAQAQETQAERDVGWIQGLIEDNLSGAGRQVIIEGFEGALSSRATIQSMTIADTEGVWFRAEGLVFEWTRSALLSGEIDVSEMSAETLAFLRPPIAEANAPAPEATPFSFALPELPVGISIDKIEAGRIILGAPLLGEELAFSVNGTVSLAGGEGSVTLVADRLDGAAGQFDISGNYSNQTRILGLDLDLREEAGGIIARVLDLPQNPSVHLSLGGTAPIDDYTANLSISTADIERITGDFGFVSTETGQDLRLDIQGDVNALIETDYADFFGPEMRLALRGGRDAAGTLNLSQLSIEARALSLNGSAEIGADGWPLRLALDGRLAAQDGSPVLLPLGTGETTVREALITLGYDAGAGDTWTLRTTATDIDRTDMTVPSVSLTGQGIIRPGDGSANSLVNGTLTYSATGLDLNNPALAQAIGREISGDLMFEAVQGAPFEISRLTLAGPGIETTANATVTTTDGVLIRTDLALDAADLGRFRGITGLDLQGAAELDISGEVRPLDGMFDLSVSGATSDLALGIAALDPQLAGTATLTLQASRDTEGTRIQGLQLLAPNISATGSADIASSGSTATFDATLREIGLSLPELSGPGRLVGVAQIAADQSGTLEASVTLPDANLRIEAIAAAVDAGGEVTIDLRGAVADLAPYAPLIGTEVGGSANLALTGTTARDISRFDLTLNARTRDLTTGIVPLDGLLRGPGTLNTRILRTTSQAFRLEALSLDTAELALQADASLTGTALASNLDLQLADLATLFDGLSGPGSLSGTATGDIAGILSTDLAATGPGSGNLSMQADIDLGGQNMPVSGTISASIETLSAYSSLAGSELSGSLETEIVGSMAGLTDPANSAFDLSYQITGQDLAGYGRGLAGVLTGGGTLQRSGDGILQTESLLAGPGNGRFSVRSQLAPDGMITGTITARVDELAPYSDLAGLRLAGQLDTRLTGTAMLDASALDLAFDIGGADLAANGTALTGGIDLSGTATRAPGGEIRLDLSGTAPGDAEIALTAQGTDSLQTSLTVRAGNIGAYAGLVGRPLGGGISASLAGPIRIDTGAFDIGLTTQTTNVDVGIPAVATLLRGTGDITGQISRGADGQLSVQSLQIAYPNISMTGELSGQDGGGIGRFDARLRDVGLFTDSLSGAATAQGTARLLSDGSYGLSVSATGPGGMAANIDGSIAPDATLNLTISGSAPLGLANSFIEPRRLSGNASFDLAVNGPAALGSLSGAVRLSDGRLAAPSFQQAIEGLGGTVTLSGGTAQLDLQGQLEAGGRLSVSGPIELGVGQVAGLQITGERLVLRDPNLYDTTADANVTITGPLAGGALIGGLINLGPTEIQVPSSTTSTLGPLPQVRHLGATAPVRQTLNRAGLTLGGVDAAASDSGSSRPLGLDLTISAPARVFIRGRGLDAELGGQLRITGTTAQIIPIGEFQLIRGRIDILEQRFELDEGGAFLQGDFDPFVRLVATTEARDGTIVNITVEGPATEPEVTFSSSPELPQDEVLSRLIFGRDLSEISPLQAIQLAAAVSTLAGNSGGGLLSDFRQGLGLDDLDITTDEDGNAAVRAGAYLSENVYTDVTVGSENTEINLNLDLTDDITITGSAGSDGDTSIGIFFERDY